MCQACGNGQIANTTSSTCECPSTTPFWDGSSCIACYNPKYFDATAKKCLSCPKGQIYNLVAKACTDCPKSNPYFNGK